MRSMRPGSFRMKNGSFPLLENHTTTCPLWCDKPAGHVTVCPAAAANEFKVLSGEGPTAMTTSISDKVNGATCSGCTVTNTVSPSLCGNALPTCPQSAG